MNFHKKITIIIIIITEVYRMSTIFVLMMYIKNHVYLVMSMEI